MVRAWSAIARVIELLDRLHQAEVALLDQVEEEHPPADVALGDGDDQAQVGLGEALFRRLVPFLHPARQIDLFVPRKKRHAADVFEIHLDGIVQADVFEGLLKQLAVALVLVHDLDARLADRLIDIVDLIGAGVDLFQDVAQHVRRDAALLAIFADDLFEDLVEFLFGNAHGFACPPLMLKNFENVSGCRGSYRLPRKPGRGVYDRRHRSKPRRLPPAPQEAERSS